MEPTPYIWMNGELVDWDDATVHVGVARAALRVGRVRGHPLLRDAAGPGGLPPDRPHEAPRDVGLADLHAAPVLRATSSSPRPTSCSAANGLPACYIRPIAFYGYGTLGVPPRENPVYVAIMSWPWGTYLGAEALEKGIRAKISTWRRVGPNTIPHAAKATGVYLNSMLAVMEANRAGYDEALLLTEDGYVGDGSGENIFVVKDGVIYTPDLSASILPGHHEALGRPRSPATSATRSARSR